MVWYDRTCSVMVCVGVLAMCVLWRCVVSCVFVGCCGWFVVGVCLLWLLVLLMLRVGVCCCGVCVWFDGCCACICVCVVC